MSVSSVASERYRLNDLLTSPPSEFQGEPGNYRPNDLCQFRDSLYAVKRTPRTPCLTAALDLPTSEPSLNAHTHASRRAGSIFARWNVGAPCGGCTLAFSGCMSLRTEGGRRIRLPGESRVERRLRVSVEEGRSSILDRLIGTRGLYARSAVARRSFSLSVSAFGLYLGVGISTSNSIELRVLSPVTPPFRSMGNYISASLAAKRSRSGPPSPARY
jgi:hypothetical protein